MPVRRSSTPATIERDLIDDFFEDFGGGLFHLPRIFRRRGWPAPSELHLPRLASVDVYETKDEVVVKAELAGIAKGMVSRTVDLPAEVKGDKASAKLTDGVLEIRIPKTDEAKARAVKVKVQ